MSRTATSSSSGPSLPCGLLSITITATATTRAGHINVRRLRNRRKLIGLLVAAGAATFGAVWVIWSKTKWTGIGGIVALLALALIVHVRRKRPTPIAES